VKADQPTEHTNYMKVGQDLQDDSGLQEAHFVQLVSSYFVSISCDPWADKKSERSGYDQIVSVVGSEPDWH
jgi:hypothetical protein